MQYLGTTDKIKDIINKEFVEKLLGNYQPLISDSSKLAYSLISGVPSSLPASDVYSWAKAVTKPDYSWGEIGSKPNFASVATSGKYDDLIGKPTLLSSFTDDIVSGKYLPLSGGTIQVSNGTIFDANFANDIFGYNPDYGVYIGSTSNTIGSYWIYSGSAKNPNPMFYRTGEGIHTIWHSGNDGSGSGLDADLLDGKQPNELAVLSATKLATARTIWGQTFNGMGNIDGDLIISNGSSTPTKIKSFVDSGNAYTTIGSEEYPIIINHAEGSLSLWKGENNRQLTLSRDGSIVHCATVQGGWAMGNAITANDKSWSYYINGALGVGSNLTYYYYGGRYDNPLMVITPQGNVGIGTTSPSYKLDVNGSSFIKGELVSKGGVFGGNGGSNPANYWWGLYQWDGKIQLSRRTTSNGYESDYFYIDVASKNIVFSAGITMYSDQRKKTILNHVELSLKEIANAPIIEHYYNSDDKKTTHVGSIAQYWASMNDWFCKKDSEGYYTMEIQNAALASAISVARELDRYETKTDKTIKQLRKRICQLEEEVERLKSA